MADMRADAVDPPTRSGPFAGHSERERPLVGYGVLTGAFNALAVAGLVGAARTGRLPERYAASDLATMGVATYKLSRLIAKDRVTSVLRAPVTVDQQDSGRGEVEEAARGRGLHRAVGELLVCPDCVQQWVVAGFFGGHLYAPRATRTVAAMFVAYALADACDMAFTAVKSRI